MRLHVFRKSRWTNRHVPQFDRQQLIPTAETSNSKGSQTSIRPMARHNKIPTNSGSQSRPTRDCQTLGAKRNKVSRERDLQDTWTLACRLYIWHAAGKEANAVQSRQVICDQNASNLESDGLQSSTQTAKVAVEAKRHRKRLERRWNETKSDTDRLAYRRACRHANKLINSSRQDYFRSQLSSATDSKQRWQIAKTLLHSFKTVHERSTDELKQLCKKFSVFSLIKYVHSNFNICNPGWLKLYNFSLSCAHLRCFDFIAAVTVDQVSK